MKEKIKEFDLKAGRNLGKNYEIVSLLGKGWEGEVYKIKDKRLGIERAAKLFLPYRNLKNKVSDAYAKRLHALKDCPDVIHYHHSEKIRFRGEEIVVLISEYVEGKVLSVYLNEQKGKRLTLFQGVHLLHALATAVERIHQAGQYHGDIHSDNIILRRVGLSYDLKLLDFFHWGKATRDNKREDIIQLIHVFYEAIGGKKHYAKYPQQVKDICRGLKRSLILKQFSTAHQLKTFLENQIW